MSLQYVDTNIQMVSLMRYILHTYIHTLHNIQLCVPFRTKPPKPHGKKRGKHNIASTVKLKCYIMRINTSPIKILYWSHEPHAHVGAYSHRRDSGHIHVRDPCAKPLYTYSHSLLQLPNQMREKSPLIRHTQLYMLLLISLHFVIFRYTEWSMI